VILRIILQYENVRIRCERVSIGRHFEHGGKTWLIEWWWWFLAVRVRLSASRSSFVVIQGLSHVCARSTSALSHTKRVSAGTCGVQNSGKRNTL